VAAGVPVVLPTSYGPWGVVLMVIGGLLLLRAWLVRAA
jgi:hypothetical protein